MGFHGTSNTMMAEIAESFVDAVFIINSEGIITGCNQAAMGLFGYKESELIGQNVAMLMPQPHKNLHNHYLQRYIEKGEAHIIGYGRVVTAVRKDGSTFSGHLAISEHFVRGEYLFSGVIRDQTNEIAMRLELEQQLTESSILLNSLSAIIKTKDPNQGLKEVLSIICKALTLPGSCGWFKFHGEGHQDSWVSHAESEKLLGVIDQWLLTLDTKKLIENTEGERFHIISKELPAPNIRNIAVFIPQHSSNTELGIAFFTSSRCPSLNPYFHLINTLANHWLEHYFGIGD